MTVVGHPRRERFEQDDGPGVREHETEQAGGERRCGHHGEQHRDGPHERTRRSRRPRPAQRGEREREAKQRATHHVATTPQTIPSTVGDSIATIRGWPIVKYSTHTPAVTWSCAMP